MALQLDPTSLGLELGSGAVIGGIVGFAAKKIAKLIAVIIGIELALFKFLETRGVLDVNWDALSSQANNVTQQATNATSGGSDAVGAAPPSWITSLLGALPVSAGFTGGFLVGFKRG
jgi:uncharacterized membrane protein (Fun14 family)